MDMPEDKAVVLRLLEESKNILRKPEVTNKDIAKALLAILRAEILAIEKHP